VQSFGCALVCLKTELLDTLIVVRDQDRPYFRRYLLDFASRAKHGERDRRGRAIAADPQFADQRKSAIQ
jgi:hypothetical protein